MAQAASRWNALASLRTALSGLGWGEAAWQAAARVLPELVPSHRAVLCISEGHSGGRHQRWKLAGGRLRGPQLQSHEATALERCLDTGKVILVCDARVAEEPDIRRAAAGGMSSCCFVPIVGRGRSAGAWMLARSEPDGFSEQDVQSLSWLAAAMAELLAASPGDSSSAHDESRDPRPRLCVDFQGRVQPGYDRILDAWFGAPAKAPAVAALSLWDWIGQRDPRAAHWLELAWEGLGEGELPAEVVLQQMPDNFRR